MAYLYDPKEVIVSINGEEITGFAPSSFISLEFNNAPWSVTEGIDGSHAYSPRMKPSATLKLSLLQGSIGSYNLNGIASKYRSDISSGQLSFTPEVSISITDYSSTFHWSLDYVLITKEPSITYGKTSDEGARDWEFYCPTMTYDELTAKPITTQSTAQQLLGLAGIPVPDIELPFGL